MSMVLNPLFLTEKESAIVKFTVSMYLLSICIAHVDFENEYSVRCMQFIYPLCMKLHVFDLFSVSVYAVLQNLLDLVIITRVRIS